MALKFGISQSKVSCLYQRYNPKDKVVERHVGGGRTQATSAADDRYAVMQSLRSMTLRPKLWRPLQNVWCVNVYI